jgi:hypothetical protein
MRRTLLAAAVVAACSTQPPRPPPVLTTLAEKSGYVRTGRYDEVATLCRDFARVYRRVACETIGTTLEDRPIYALRITGARAARGAAPVILIQAGIHAGEIEGKDAGFWFLRDLLDGRVARGALDAIDVVFVPVLNPDGHERFGPNNRPNQRGPEQMGFRTNAANHNLNRDYMKAETAELQALLRIVAGDDPVMLIDLHTTDGAKFEHDISVNVAPLAPRGDALDETAAAISAEVMTRLTELGHLPVPFYPSFVDEADPASGFSIGEPPPRFSHAYASARSRLGVLVETHSWRTYKERTTSTYHALAALFEQAATDAGAWRAAELAADAADRALTGSVPILFDTDSHTRTIEFRGYAYEKRASDVSGGTWLVYDEKTPQIWTVPLEDQLVPVLSVTVPGAGYVVDGGFAPAVKAVLDRHGLESRWIDDQPTVAAEVFRATKVTHQPTFEGATRVAVEGAWTAETRTLDRHALFVPVHQRAIRVVLGLLDPAAPDSLVQWGLFNAVFERKEYMEPYVAEEVARAMLADPATAQAWAAALAADPQLAGNPQARLEWFYRRHAAWDERKDLIPVYRVAAPP